MAAKTGEGCKSDGYFQNDSGISLTQRAPEDTPDGPCGREPPAFGAEAGEATGEPRPQAHCAAFVGADGNHTVQALALLFPALGSRPTFPTLTPKQVTVPLGLYFPFSFLFFLIKKIKMMLFMITHSFPKIKKSGNTET